MLSQATLWTKVFLALFYPYFILFYFFLQFKQYFADSNFPEWTKGSQGITVPLSFPEKESSPFMDKDRIIICLLCEEKFEYPRQKDEFLVHLTCEHRFIIANVEMISDLPSYIAYWRNKFVQAKVVTDYCKAVKMKSGEGENAIEEDFFVLSDAGKNTNHIFRESIKNGKFSLISK